MRAGVSTACLYPKLLEESVYDLALNGIAHTEIFVNTGSELERNYINGLASTLKQFEVTCRSLHPFTCAMEPMMFFSGYKRRVDDMLEFYKKYFEAMNILGAEIFIFHGNKKIPDISKEIYYESFSRLAETGREFGITVAQENVARCVSGSLSFMKDMVRNLGGDAKFVLDTKQSVRAGESNSIFFVHWEVISFMFISASRRTGEIACKLAGGRFNIRKFLSMLNENSPDCSVMLELYRSNFEGISDLVNNYNTLVSMIGKL